MRGRRRLVVTLYVSVALATTAVVLVLWAGEVLRSADLETANVRFSVPGEHAAPDVVVGIDAGTFATVKRLPSSRTLHARVIGGLRRAGAKVIAYDVQFGAQEMAGPALEEVNTWIRARGGEDVKIGIGLNVGPVMDGDVASERRMEYTTIGHTTNTSSCLESATKGTGHTIFLADCVRRMLTSECGDIVRVDEVQVRGRDDPGVVWSLA
jgi:class 3 adenylate cyclase